MARHDALEDGSMVTVHVYRAEEGGFWAEMPEYPGGYTQAETMDELEESVREAVQCYIEAAGDQPSLGPAGEPGGGTTSLVPMTRAP